MRMDLPSYGLLSKKQKFKPFGHWRILTFNQTSAFETGYPLKCIISSEQIPFTRIRSDGRDIVFLDSYGNLLPYWIEDKNATQMIVWFKIPTSKSFVSLHAYYNNLLDAGATAISAAFKYKRKITITEQSGENLTDYQVCIELDSSNFDFSHTKSDGSDIRFTDENGSPLDYWIEKWDPTSEEAKVWVKVPSIPANNNIKIYMFYGNNQIQKASSGKRTFDFFDDFSCDICSNFDLKFGIFTDLHWTDKSNRNGEMGYECYSERVSKITEVIDAFNNEEDLDFVIELGDFIDGAGGSLPPEEELSQAESYYDNVEVPRYYVYGNHDVNSNGVTKDYFKQHTAKSADYEYHDFGNYRIIILDACYGGGEYLQGEIPNEELSWLENEALNTDKKCIVFTHQPLSEYKGEWESEVRISNRVDVRAVLENAGNVIGVFQGHIHGNFKEIINGIPYFTLEGLRDECGNDWRAYGIVYVKGDRIFLRGFKGMASTHSNFHTVLAGSEARHKKWYFDIDTKNNKLINHPNTYAASGAEKFGVAYLTGVNLANFEIRVKTKEVDDDIIGILFCYQNSSQFYHYSYSNDYTGTTTDTENYGPKRWIGKDTTTWSQSHLDYDNNAPAVNKIVEITIRRWGSNIKVFQDGIEILSATDSSYTSGDIGLMTNGCQNAEFHPPFIVRKYTDPEPAVSVGQEERI